MAGIPHPGTFVLNADGTVRSKHFYSSYRERDSGVGVLDHLLGITAETTGAPTEAAADGVTVRAWFDKDTYAWGQRIWLSVELEIADGLHIYGNPVPDGYSALDVSIDPVDRVISGAAQLPQPRAFQIAGLEEQFRVYEGRVRVTLPVTFMLVDGGRLEVGINVSFQACSTTDCLAPQSVRLLLSIAEDPLIERPQPRA